jgi:1-deoxy-D-xylulose-5-phosphate synthase
VAIRYPRGSGVGVPLDQVPEQIPYGKSEIVRKIEGAPSILAVGNMVHPAMAAAKALSGEGIELNVVNIRFIKPLDRDLIISLAGSGRLFTIEDNVLQGGFGSSVLELLNEEGCANIQVTRLGYPDVFIEQGEQGELYERYSLTAERIADTLRKALA